MLIVLNQQSDKLEFGELHRTTTKVVTGVAIRSPFGIFVIQTRKGMRIATPVCALARNDIRVF